MSIFGEKNFWGKKNILIITFIAITYSCRSKKEKLSLKVEPQTINFGVVTQGDTVQLLYLVKNVSQDTVRISKINTGCGCAVSEHPEFIPPLQMDSLKIIYSSLGDSGTIEKVIMIESDKFPIFQPIFFKGKVQ